MIPINSTLSYFTRNTLIPNVTNRCRVKHDYIIYHNLIQSEMYLITISYTYIKLIPLIYQVPYTVQKSMHASTKHYT